MIPAISGPHGRPTAPPCPLKVSTWHGKRCKYLTIFACDLLTTSDHKAGQGSNAIYLVLLQCATLVKNCTVADPGFQNKGMLM